jgi:TonB family protein
MDSISGRTFVRIFVGIFAGIFAGLMGLILLCGAGLACQGTSQKIDPFYLERLGAGERAFYAGNFETAVEEMKIALIGLGGEKELMAKAHVYLGLSYYQLKNAGEAKTSLRKATSLLDMEDLKALISNEAVWNYLNRVMIDLGIQGPEVRGETALQLRNLEQRQMGSEGGENFVKNLEQQIKSNPRNVSLYYELYEYRMGNANTKEAKKTLEDLIKKNPNEAKAYYLLGRIQYQQRNLKDADQNLQRVFSIQKIVPVEEYVLLEAQAYLMLTTHLRGDRQSSYRMFAEWADRFTDEKIRYLDLEEQDRAIFLGIAHAEGTQAEIERLKIEAQSAERGEVEEGQVEKKRVEEKRIEERQAEKPPPVKTKVEGTVEEKGVVSESAQQTKTKDAVSGELKAGDLVPIDQVDTPPVLKSRVNPKYPSNAFAMGIEGIVIVNALITETGDVVEVVVIQGLSGQFNEATTKAVKQWKYEPALKDGVKVKVWKQITVTFKLKQDQDV